MIHLLKHIFDLHLLLFYLSFSIFLNFGCKNKPATFERVINSPQELKDHSKEFEKQIISVTDNIHVAVGFGLANSIMIIGDKGRIIVDVMESVQAASEVRKAFDTISDLPIEAIIYTHNHADHIFGATAFVDGDNEIEVIAQELMPYYLDRIVTVVRPIIEKRSYRMFGNFLDQDARINCGIGSHLNIDEDSELGVIRPTLTFRDSLFITVAGVKLQLYHAPGETNDQLFVFLPEENALLCGDNFYRSFPNLYTIRGTEYRDVNAWKSSLDMMRYKHPDFLIPSHSRPISGKDTIWSILTDYRDAIQYVHDQTIRGMNKGLTSDELADSIILPPHLARSPYLQEFYGQVDWSVRAIFSGNLGPFDGNPSNLSPLKAKEIANHIADLAGGPESLSSALSKAIDEEDYQWALELSDHLLQILPDDQDIKEHRKLALTYLGERESNPNLRHYYLTSALEMSGLQNEGIIIPSTEMAHSVPMPAIFNAFATLLDPYKSHDTDTKVVFRFPDSGEEFSIHVRRGIAEVQEFALPDPDLEIEVNAKVWKEIAAELRTANGAFLKGDLKVKGNKLDLLSFMKLFDRE